MRIVLDTNALVSAAIQPAGNPAKMVDFVLSEVAAGRVAWLTSPEILSEYREKLLLPRIRRKYPNFAHHAERLLSLIETATVQVAPNAVDSAGARDPDDVVFVAVARAGGADHLVTGNRKHFPERVARARVLTPAEFVRDVIGLRG